MTRARAAGPSTPSTLMSAPSRARRRASTSRARTARQPPSRRPSARMARADRAGVHGQAEQHPVPAGDRRRLVHQGAVGTAGRRFGDRVRRARSW